MDDNGQRENGRHKPDQYKSVHAQWLMSQHQMKDHRTVNLMAVIAERDIAVQQRNQARSEKEAAFAERDQAILNLNAAINDRNKAIMEREEAFKALENARKNGVVTSSVRGCPPGCTALRGMKHIHHNDLPPQPPQLSDAPYEHARDVHISEATPISVVPEGASKVRRPKRPRKEARVQAIPSKKASKPPRKSKRSGEAARGGEDLNKQAKHEWKDQDLGLNQVAFDDTTMPVPVCSCTGTFRQCYKWGNGGWQSSCCTTTLSMYPLPVAPNKRHARVSGRKMSGGAFSKLLSRLAAEGHDLSMPLDLRDHWAKHGTNRYITIK